MIDLLQFQRPASLEATSPPEARGVDRDSVRLLVSENGKILHRSFLDLPTLLDPGDLLVVNESGTLPASLPAHAGFGPFRVNLSTRYGDRLWLVEPRWGLGQPGPVPLHEGERFVVAGISARLVTGYPGIPRLVFVEFDGDIDKAMKRFGAPIRYGYVREAWPLDAYQTMFAVAPGSVEMPSAARPFTPRLVAGLTERGVGIVSITLHTGVSSLEAEPNAASPPIYPEPFQVSSEAVARIHRARESGRRVVAVGTTVVRALESATEGGRLRPARGFTRAFIEPHRGAHTVDGLVTGFHDPRTTHLAMLESFLDRSQLQRAYEAAIAGRYLWHEFGDSHLILRW